LIFALGRRIPVGTSATEKRREIDAEQERLVSGPMTEQEVRLLRDFQAFIDFAIRNGLGFARVLGAIGHDVNGIVRYGSSCKEARADGFLPAVSGHSEITTDSVGEPAESAG
jgi:hypothetical protein